MTPKSYPVTSQEHHGMCVPIHISKSNERGEGPQRHASITLVRERRRLENLEERDSILEFAAAVIASFETVPKRSCLKKGVGDGAGSLEFVLWLHTPARHMHLDTHECVHIHTHTQEK